MKLELRVDGSTAAPVYVQLIEQIRLLIHRGVLREGNQMPTVRSLAVDLGINANTVARVYRDLQREGVLRLERGVGTFVERPTAQPPLGKRDFGRIEKTARRLVTQCGEAGFTRRELSELVTILWKEINA